MSRKPPKRPTETLPNLALVGLGFLMGALLGGLLMLVLSGQPVEPLSAVPKSDVSASDDSLPTSRSQTPPEAVAAWRSSSPQGSYRPVGTEKAGTVEMQVEEEALSAEEERLLAPIQKRLQTGIFLLLGVIVVEGAMIVLVLRRADARLEQRILRFERLMSQTNRDWLSNLDVALEGEWEEEER